MDKHGRDAGSRQQEAVGSGLEGPGLEQHGKAWTSMAEKLAAGSGGKWVGGSRVGAAWKSMDKHGREAGRGKRWGVG
jgi:hypothetical protein